MIEEHKAGGKAYWGVQGDSLIITNKLLIVKLIGKYLIDLKRKAIL